MRESESVLARDTLPKAPPAPARRSGGAATERAAEKAEERRRRAEQRSADRMRRETVNAGVRVARILVDKLFGRTR